MLVSGFPALKSRDNSASFLSMSSPQQNLARAISKAGRGDPFLSGGAVEERRMEREMPGTKDASSSEGIRPEAIERLQAGIGPALALLAGMQLEVFTHLAAGPRDAAALAAALGVAGDRLQRLLYALVAAELLELRAGTFVN